MLWSCMTKHKTRRVEQIMLLGPLLAQYEEELIAVGEEAESLSFAYRALKTGLLQTLSLPCKRS